ITKAVLLNLCIAANDKTNICWPSHNRIAKQVGIHRCNVSRHITELKKLGLISAEKTKGANGWLRNVYTIRCYNGDKSWSSQEHIGVITASHRVLSQRNTNLNPNLNLNLRATTKVERSRIRSGEEPDGLGNIIDNPTLPASFQLWKDKALGGRRR